MPTIKETELDSQQTYPCSYCPDYEGAIWLCGEGYLCERCFAVLAEIDEDNLFDDSIPLDEFVIPEEQKAKARGNLHLLKRDDVDD